MKIRSSTKAQVLYWAEQVCGVTTGLSGVSFEKHLNFLLHFSGILKAFPPFDTGWLRILNSTTVYFSLLTEAFRFQTFSDQHQRLTGPLW